MTRRTMTKGVISALQATLIGCGGRAAAPPAPPQPTPGTALFRGGSNYNWYQVDAGNVYDPHHVIVNYNTQSTVINAQLASMYANGQRRLAVYLYDWNRYVYVAGVPTLNPGVSGTLVDVTGGALPSQIQANLTAFLAAVKAAGFQQIIFGLAPQGVLAPSTWPSWQETYFQLTWQVVQAVRPLLVASGLSYLSDTL